MTDAGHLLHPLKLNVLSFKEEEHDYHFRVELPEPVVCQACGALEGKLVKFGKEDQSFRDVPIHGKRSTIWVIRRRYRCADCDSTFRQPVPHMDDKRSMTSRLVKYIEKASMLGINTDVARDVGVDEHTVRRIFESYYQAEDAKYTPKAPKVLGIDKLFLGKEYRAIFTNITEQTVIELLPSRTLKTVTHFLGNLEGRKDIQIVCTDMWGSYRTAVKSVLPHATMVVDKFHITRMANEAMDTVRKGLKGSWAVLEEVWAEAKSRAESTPAGLADSLGSMPDQLARHIATRMARSLNNERAKRLGKLLHLEKVAPCDALLASVAEHPHPIAQLWLLVAEADVEHRHWLPEHEANAGLLLAAQALGVDLPTVQASVKAELKAKHFAEDQKPPLPLDPAAQASGVRGGKANETKPGRNPGKRKSPTTPAAQAPTLSAEDASRGIAAAMQGLEEDGRAHPAGAPGEPNGSNQRAAPVGIEAAPLHPQAATEPVPTTNTPADEAPAKQAAAFAAGDHALLDGEKVTVMKRKKQGCEWWYTVGSTTGIKSVLGSRLGAA